MSGLVTGVAAGTATITASFNGLVSTPANVTVTLTGGVTGTSLAVARNDHTSSLITVGPNTGKVLVVGGYGNGTTNSSSLDALGSVEMYDPVTSTWTTVTSLNIARGDQTSVTLQNGQVLVTGGTDSYSNLLPSTELYDPIAGTWTSACDLNVAREYNAISLLQDGTVLVAGGNDGVNIATNTAEVFDPSVITTCGGAWTSVVNMIEPRNTPAATLLIDGTVLVTGGYNVVGPNLIVFSSSEVFDPRTKNWNFTSGNMTDGRYQHTSTLLQNGKVLVVGGLNANAGNTPLASAELYDPSTGLWTPTGSLGTARAIHTATLLPNGNVLVMGGLDATGYPFASTEIFDPNVTDSATGRMGSWTTTSSLVNARDNFTATLIPYDALLNPNYPNGSVLAVGGDGVAAFINSTEIYWW
jgi:N-acetylneuraminic acid mutarotase